MIEVIDRNLKLRFKQFYLFESTANNAILALLISGSSFFLNKVGTERKKRTCESIILDGNKKSEAEWKRSKGK